jgi:hypothetical protein
MSDDAGQMPTLIDIPNPCLATIFSKNVKKAATRAREVPLLEQSAYAPAAGKLAAAMATIPARRRPTRKPAALSKDFKRRISTDPGDGRGFSARKSTPKKSALAQWYGQAPRACRDHSENSNAATVRSLCGSRIIAAKEPAMDKIFSAKRLWTAPEPGPDSIRTRGSEFVTRTGFHLRIKSEGMLGSKTLYPGKKPKVRSKRLT